MKFNLKVISILLLLTSSQLEAKELEYEKIYKQRCQACHGTIHQGDIGADLREKALKMKDPYRLSSSLIDGVQGVMPSYSKIFSKSEAIDMVDWLMGWEDNSSLTLKLDYVNRYRIQLADRNKLANKYKKPVDVKSLDDITFLTERDISLVTFLDSTSGRVLSRHRAGYAVHITIQNKKYPRYAYSISRSGRLTMFDLMAPGQPAIAYIRVGEESRGLAISNDGKYIMVGNYYPAGAVILDALTLKALKVFDTSSEEGIDGKKVSSKIAGVSSTPYAPYFTMVLKEAGSVKIIDYSNSKFPIVGSVKNLGKNLHDAFLNEDKGIDYGRYYMVASQVKGGDILIIDLKTKKLVEKIDLGKDSIPHTGQGASWYSKKLKKQFHASADMGRGVVTVWDSSGKVIKKIKISDKGLFVGTSDKTPYLWADCVWGKAENYNEMHLINKESLEVERIIKVGKERGQLIDAKSKKVLQEWDAQQYLPVKRKVVKSKISKERLTPYQEELGRKVKYPIVPKLLHAEPANHGAWTMISEWTTGRVGIYDSKSGEFIKYIYNLTTPTYLYSVEHRKSMAGS
jgi:nitrite reductase (NO-forming)/hydroxylamine reductase